MASFRSSGGLSHETRRRRRREEGPVSAYLYHYLYHLYLTWFLEKASGHGAHTTCIAAAAARACALLVEDGGDGDGGGGASGGAGGEGERERERGMPAALRACVHEC